MIGRPPTIGHVWIVLTVAAASIGPASLPIGVPDTYWTLLTGEWLIRQRVLLDADPFTSAPPAAGPVLNVQWLADVIFRGLYVIGGLPLVITGTAIVVATAFALLLAATVTASGHLRLSCVAVWLAYALGASNLSPRPQTLAYPLFALFLLAVVRTAWRKDTRLLWLLPPAVALWANLHGSFFVGLVLLACAAAGCWITARNLRSTRPYVVTLAACALASLVNPYGVGALEYVATIGDNPVIRDIVTEWAPTTISSQAGILFFGSACLIGMLAFKSRLRLTASEALTLLVFGYLAWASLRAIVWWGFVLASVVARLAGGALPNRRPTATDRPLINALIIVGVLVLVAYSLPWTKTAVPILPASKRGVLSDDTPVGVGEYLRTHDPPSHGLMFNNQSWGGYLEWVAWPRHKVFVDGRFELHPTQVWLDYLDVVFPSARWRSLLDKYDISYLVLSTSDQADLIADVRADPEWRLDYEDVQAEIFSKVSSAGP